MAVVDHVIVLVLENRSFDHMLGFLGHPDPRFDGIIRGGPHANPGWGSGLRVPAAPHAKHVLPIGPDHSHEAVMEQLALRPRAASMLPTNQGFVSSLERKGRGLAPPTFGGLLGPILDWWAQHGPSEHPNGPGMGPLAMLCQPPTGVPVLSRLALEFAVCTRWFCSLPGETWPNRNFLHAATSDGEVDIDVRSYTNPTIFELLEEKGESDHGKTWHIYHDDTPQVWAFPHLWETPERHANWFRTCEFTHHVEAGMLPAYSFIEPNHRPPLHTLDHAPVIGAPDVSNSEHPENNLVALDSYESFDSSSDTDFTRGEALIADIYEVLRKNPDVFSRSILLITYDEHGGLYDHVPPIRVPSPGDTQRSWTTRLQHALWHRKAEAFDFTMLGPRVPAVVVSPFVPARKVDDRVRDHASVPATLRALFAPHAEPLTARDGWAAPFHDLLTLMEPRQDLPDLSEYTTTTFREPPAAFDPPDASQFPSFYEDFIQQAKVVHQHLVNIGEPEAAQQVAPTQLQQANRTTKAFSDAASRHRSARSRARVPRTQ
jgi:phospholipase C